MKKLFLLMTMLWALFATQAYAQVNSPEVTVSDITATSALVSWDMQKTPSGFELICITETDQTVVVREELGPGTKQLSLTDLSPETTYIVSVRAILMNNNFSDWEPVTFTTLAEEQESNVPKLTVSDITSTTAHLSWGVPTSWEGEVTTFEVGFGIPLDKTPTVVQVTGKEFDLANLSPDTEYSVAVRGVIKLGKETRYSDWSEPVRFTTLAPAPEITVSDITPTSAHLSWTGDSPAYDVVVSLGESVTRIDVTGNEYDLTDLLPGTDYTVTVQGYRMVKKTKKEPTTDLGMATFTTLAEKESNVPKLTVSDITSTTAHLSWVVPTSWEGEITTFEVSYGKPFDRDPIVVPVTGKEFDIINLSPNTEYVVAVRGVIKLGKETRYSDWSEPVEFTTLAPAPEITVSDITSTGAHVAWTGVEADHFEVLYGVLDPRATANTVLVTGNEYDLTELSPSTEYIVAVRGVKETGKSIPVYTDWSEPVRFRTNADSGVNGVAANGVKVVAANGSITIYNSDVYVESVAIIDMQGRVLGNYEVNTRHDITIPAHTTGMAVVVVNTADKQLVYKVIVK